MSEQHTLTSSEYIKHHLTNLTYGNHPEHGWSFAHNAQEAKEMGFQAINVDTLGWSIVLGLIFCFMFRMVAVRATTGVPGKFQAAIETFNKAIALLPDTKFVYSQRSQAHEALNRHEQALNDFNT